MDALSILVALAVSAVRTATVPTTHKDIELDLCTGLQGSSPPFSAEAARAGLYAAMERSRSGVVDPVRDADPIAEPAQAARPELPGPERTRRVVARVRDPRCAWVQHR